MSRTVFVQGTGSIGMRHLRLLAEFDDVRPIAIPARAARIVDLEAMGFEAATDVGAVPPGSDDAAIICTDTSRHVEDALRLLGRCSLLIEKPVAVDASEAGTLAAAAAGRTDVFVGYPLRFSPVIEAVAAAIPRLGRLSSMSVECQSWLPGWRPERDYRSSYSASADEGGVLRDLSHEIDYTIGLVGRPNALMAQFAPATLDIRAEDSVDLMWRTEAGACVFLRLDYVSRVQRRRIVLTAANGAIEADLLTGRITGLIDDEPVDMAIALDPDSMYRAQLRAFLQNGGARLCTLDEALYTMKVIDAARRAAVTNCQEQVDGSR